MEDVSENLLLGNAEVDILIIWMGALMDDPIHVQIQIVKLWNLQENQKGGVKRLCRCDLLLMVTNDMMAQ